MFCSREFRFCIPFIVLLLLLGCRKKDEGTVTGSLILTSPTVGSDFVKRSGTGLVVGAANQSIQLRGVNLSYDRVASSDPSVNWRMADYTDWGTPVTTWYQEKHFASLSTIGFNVARLNLSYRIFEDNSDPGNYKASGWALLDQVIAWAKKYNLYLILDMHVAPGGAGIISCLGCGWRTWDDATYQSRFKALWREIARRYKDETTIAAFDLLNEPAPTGSVDQWKTLAQALVDEIRKEDTNHLLIVEMVNWIFDKNDQSTLSNLDLATLQSFQFLVSDANAMYDFHFYLPGNYTLQDEKGIDGGGYPEAGTMETTFAGTTAARDKAYLSSEMDQVLAYWKAQGVPYNFGEWGTADSAIQNEATKGGVSYIKDVMSLMTARSASWQFYYFNRLYQVDCCYSDNPTTLLSQELLDAFKAHLAAP